MKNQVITSEYVNGLTTPQLYKLLKQAHKDRDAFVVAKCKTVLVHYRGEKIGFGEYNCAPVSTTESLLQEMKDAKAYARALKKGTTY
jgi:hypothetical protein